jgi:hypothetical protein
MWLLCASFLGNRRGADSLHLLVCLYKLTPGIFLNHFPFTAIVNYAPSLLLLWPLLLLLPPSFLMNLNLPENQLQNMIRLPLTKSVPPCIGMQSVIDDGCEGKMVEEDAGGKFIKANK